MLIGGAAINRNFGLRILYPDGPASDDVYEPGVFYCKDAFEGLAKMDQLIDPEARPALVSRPAGRRQAAARPAGCARRRRATGDRQLGPQRRLDRGRGPVAAVLGRA